VLAVFCTRRAAFAHALVRAVVGRVDRLSAVSMLRLRSTLLGEAGRRARLALEINRAGL
jgi:hypothetical protein